MTRGRLSLALPSVLPALALAIGCASTDGALGTEQSEPLPGEAAIGLGRGETLPAFAPQDTAEANWAEGEKAFEDERYILAQRFYIYLRRNFPYSKYATLADLRVSDCQYERERHRVAIDGYQNFVRLHPTHPQVPYALYKTARAHYELIPNELFIFPPAYEKDQSETRDAAKALTRYLQRYPEHRFAGEARKLLADVRERLMAHERYVADFYRKAGRLRGYVGRLERIHDAFPDVGLDPELLVEMIEVYVKLEDADKAQATLAELESKFPDAGAALRAAREAITRLPSEDAAPPPAPPAAADNPS